MSFYMTHMIGVILISSVQLLMLQMSGDSLCNQYQTGIGFPPIGGPGAPSCEGLPECDLEECEDFVRRPGEFCVFEGEVNLEVSTGNIASTVC
jgi:hypothetical protein